MKQAFLEKIKIFGVAAVAAALLTAVGWLVGRAAFAVSLTLGVGGLLMLLAAIGLLSHRDTDRGGRFPQWHRHFPHTSIIGALLIVSLTLLAAGCLVDICLQ